MIDPLSPPPDDPASPGPPPGPSSTERTWAMACHLAALAGFVGVPFGNVIGPLVVWLVKKDEMPLVADQGREALNFQITVTIALVVLGILSIIPIVFCVTIPLLAAVAVGALVLTIVAAVQANGGTVYRYPMTWRVVS